MRACVLFLLASGLLLGQVTLTVSGPATIAQGQTGSLTVTLAGSSGQNLAGLQWTLAPPTGLSWGTPVISSGDAALGKGVYCNPTSGLCLAVDAAVSPIVNDAYTDGTVMTIPATFTSTALGSLAFPLTAILGVSLSDAAITVTSGTPYSITVTPSHCSYLGNATVTYQDVLALIDSIIGLTSCSSSFAAGCSLHSLEAVVIVAGGGACSL